jgi:hypothetical protein
MIKLESKLGIRKFTKEQAEKLLSWDSGWKEAKLKKSNVKSRKDTRNIKRAESKQKVDSEPSNE